MGTYTDTYVEMLQEDLQHQYRRCFEVGTDLAQALQASEAKDKELAKEREKNTVLQLEVRRRLNLQMDTTAKVERRLVDALGVLSDRDIEVERLTFALKDKDEELAKECRKRSELQSDVIFKNQELKSFEDRIAELVHTLSCRDIEIERLTNELEIARRTIENLDTNSCVLYSENQRLETQFGAVKTLLDTERNTTAQVEKKLGDALGVLSDRDIEIERLTFALKDKDNELESVRDEHRTQIDELMEEIERLTRKNKKRIKAAELRWLIDGHTNVLDEHRTAILEVREAVDQNKETLSAAQREMLATLDRHDGLISKAWGCIDNHSDSIYKQQQSIDALWGYVKSIAAHINTGSTQENP